jgi:hypothetical protein
MICMYDIQLWYEMPLKPWCWVPICSLKGKRMYMDLLYSSFKSEVSQSGMNISDDSVETTTVWITWM